jgi:hypothetical protein
MASGERLESGRDGEGLTLVDNGALLWLIALFTYTGTLKMYDDRGTQAALNAFRLPHALLRPVAYLVAGLEPVVTGLLVFEPTRALGGLAAAFLGVAFAALASVALIRKLDTSCGCVGLVGLGRFDRIAILRGVVILAAGLLVASRSPVIEAGWLFLIVAISAVPTLALFLLRSHHRRRHHRHARQHHIQDLERARQDVLELLSSPPRAADVRS